MSTVGKKVAHHQQKSRGRFQVQLRHKRKRIHFGSYHNEDDGNFARDFSTFLRMHCPKGILLDGRYHHLCSLQIFQEFERPPRKLLVQIYLKLPIYDEKDPILVEAFAAFACDARNRIDEMLPCLDQRLVKSGLSATSNGVQNIEWGLSEDFQLVLPVMGTERCMIGSSSAIPVSESKKFVNDHFKDWEMLAELVCIYGTEHIMSIFLSRFPEGSFPKDCPGDPCHQTSVLLEGNLGEHNTTSEGFSGPSTDTNGDHSDQFQINQCTATVFDSNLHSGFQTSVLQGGSLRYPGFGHHDHNTVWEGFSGLGTNFDGDQSYQFQNDQSGVTAFDSNLNCCLEFANLEPCTINPLDWRPIIREDVPKLMSLSEAKRYLDECFSDHHWVILAETMRISSTDALFLLIERVSSEQEYHDETSGPSQEGKFGFVSLDQYQNHAMCRGLPGLSSNIQGGRVEQVLMDQPSVFVSKSSFQSESLEPCGTSPLYWPRINSEVDILNQDLE